MHVFNINIKCSGLILSSLTISFEVFWCYRYPKSFQMIPELPVRFVKKLRDKIAMYKHRGLLECQVSQANAAVTWYKNKDKIHPGEKYEISSEDVYRKLIINDVDSGDEATYMCDAVDEKTSCKLLVEGNDVGKMLS